MKWWPLQTGVGSPDGGPLIAVAECLAASNPDALAPVQTGGAEVSMSTLLAELENAGLVTTFEWDDEPETIRAQLEGLSSFPGDMSWDSYADFVEDVEDYDDAERVEQFLGLVGKHSLEAGTATVSVDTGNDAYAIGFAPKHSQQLKKAMRWITVVRRDTFT